MCGSLLCLCLQQKVFTLVFFSSFCFLTQLHLSSPPWGCEKQEAQLQTPSEFRPILRCGLIEPPLSLLTQALGEAALRQQQTFPPGCCGCEGPGPLGWPPSPPAPPKHYRNQRGCRLSSAHPSRKHSPTAVVFLRNLAAEKVQRRAGC